MSEFSSLISDGAFVLSTGDAVASFNREGWEKRISDIEDAFDLEYGHIADIKIHYTLREKFISQRRNFYVACDCSSLEEIKIHGESLVRGYQAIVSELQNKQVINFNSAKSQRGFGIHPGKPPQVRGRASFAFRRWYAAYLNSKDWSERRSAVMERADGLCEGCRAAPAKEVHHLTYDHVGYEFLWELVATCAACHDRVHGRCGA